MKTTARFTLAALALSLTSPVWGEAFQLSRPAGSPPPAGFHYLERSSMEMKDNVMKMLVGDRTMAGKMQMLASESREIESLPEGRVRVKVRRQRTVNSVQMAGQDKQETEHDPLEGQTLVGRRADGAWHFEFEDGKIIPTDEQKKKLEKYGKKWGTDETFYPEKPVEVGATWELSGERLAMFLGGGDFTSPKGKLVCTLEKMVEHDGVKCASVKIDAEVEAGMPTGDGEPEMRSKIKFQGTVLRAIDQFVDLTADLKGEMSSTGSRELGDAKMDITVKGPLHITQLVDLTPEDAAPEPADPAPPATGKKRKLD